MRKLRKRILMVSVSCLFTIAIGLLQGCDDDDDVLLITRHYAYTDAEEIIAISLSYSTYGMVANMNRVSEEIQEDHDCNVLYEENDSFSTETFTGYIGYEYNYEEAFIWTCEPDTEVDYDLSAVQAFESVRYDYTHNIELDLNISGLDDTDPDEIYQGIYDRKGEWESNYNEETYSFVFESDIIETMVSKDSNKIYAGYANFYLSQTYSYSNITYSYEGSVEFIDENEARVEFDNGEVFYVDLNNISIAD